MAIATNDGFSIGAKVPVDSRFFFDTVADMAAYPENLIPSTYFCACNGALYIYSDSNTVDATTGKWRILNGSSVSISQATETVLGGIKAVSIDSSVDTTYTTEVKIDDTTGKLYVPFSASTSTNVFKDGFVESPQTDGTNWIYSDITFNIAQFKNYSDLIAQMTAYGSLFTIKEGMTVAVQEGETITTTDSDGNDVVTEYPFGLYRWNAVESKWDHQDYLLRDEFANHVEDSAKHGSTADRFNWDGKADGNFETTDIDVSSYLFKGQSKYIVDSAYLYTQLVNLKNKLDGNYANLYETLTDFKDHEDNKHTDVLHITAQEQSELHSHTNQTDILDNLGQDTNGNLTFNGLSVAGKKVVATKTDLGQVIVGDGIEVKSDGTIYIDWYSATDNGDGTYSKIEGSVPLTLYVPKQILVVNDIPYVKDTLNKVSDGVYEVNEDSIAVTKITALPDFQTWAINKDDEHQCKVAIDFGNYLSGEFFIGIKFQGASTLNRPKRNLRFTFYNCIFNHFTILVFNFF